MTTLRFPNTEKSIDWLRLHRTGMHSPMWQCVAALMVTLIVPWVSGAQTFTPQDSQGPAARRTITNQDLEALRRKRIAEEKADERRRKELGLPSREEIRRRQEEQDRRLHEMALQIEAQRMQSEVIRAQSEATRAQLEVINARLAYQNSLNNLNNLNSYPAPVPYQYDNYGLVVPPVTIITGPQPGYRPFFNFGAPFGFGQILGPGVGTRTIIVTPGAVGGPR